MESKQGCTKIISDKPSFEASDASVRTAETFTKKVTQKYYRQAYRTEWESMPDFQGWLKGVPGQPTRAYCTFCKKSLHAHRLSLLKHTCTLKHSKAAQAAFHSQDNLIIETSPRAPHFEGFKPIAESIQKILKRDRYNNEDHAYFPRPSSQSDNIGRSPSSNSKEEQTEEEEDDEEPEPAVEVADEEINEDGAGEVEDANQTSSGVEDSERLGPPKKKYSRPDATSAQIPSYGPLTTHVLDTTKGNPIAGLRVSLYKLVEGRWTLIGEGQTNPDGRYNNLIKKEDFVAGRYKLHFDVDRYFEMRRIESLYPFIEIAFDVKSPSDDYHVPLLLSPFGYTTYRGS